MKTKNVPHAAPNATPVGAFGANPEEEPHCRFNRMVRWIEDHEFAEAKKQGWFNVLVYQASLPPDALLRHRSQNHFLHLHRPLHSLHKNHPLIGAPQQHARRLVGQ
jgi:hypothetical protein